MTDFASTDRVAYPGGTAETGPSTLPGWRARLGLYGLWLIAVAFLVSRHVMWRDEVRAWSLALTPGTVLDMLRAVHGEGHPALWYLILRGLHAIIPVREVLPFSGFVIGAAAMLIFTLRAPFRLPMLALALAGRFALFEYTVMDRNYGISVLLLFGLAALYRRTRDSGWLLGLLLFLLCNTNVHSVMLAAAFLLFWAIDLFCEQGMGWTPAWRGWLIGAVFSLLGLVACVATVYPPFNDAAAEANGSILYRLIHMPAHLGLFFISLSPIGVGSRDLRIFLIVPVLLIGSLCTLIRSPGALVGQIAAMLALLLLFALIYQGEYRHQALLVAFLLTMIWLARDGHGGRWTGRLAVLDRIGHIAAPVGRVALPALLLAQILQSVAVLHGAIHHIPESRSAELADLIRRERLGDAILLGDPDFVLEPMPYYVSNPLYFARERRFGPFTFFSKAAIRPMGPAEYLATARMLHRRTGRRVLILMSDGRWLDGIIGTFDRHGYGAFVTPLADRVAFLASTRQLAAYPPVRGDENYDVYLYPAGPGR